MTRGGIGNFRSCGRWVQKLIDLRGILRRSLAFMAEDVLYPGYIMEGII